MAKAHHRLAHRTGGLPPSNDGVTGVRGRPSTLAQKDALSSRCMMLDLRLAMPVVVAWVTVGGAAPGCLACSWASALLLWGAVALLLLSGTGTCTTWAWACA
jgi:hypothetical protein